MPSYNPYIRIQGAAFNSSAGQQLQSQAISSLRDAFTAAGTTVEKVGKINTKELQDSTYKNGLNIANTGTAEDLQKYLQSNSSNMTTDQVNGLTNQYRKTLAFRQGQQDRTEARTASDANKKAALDSLNTGVRDGAINEAFTQLDPKLIDNITLTGSKYKQLDLNTEVGATNIAALKDAKPRSIDGLSGEELLRTKEYNNSIIKAKHIFQLQDNNPVFQKLLVSGKVKLDNQENLGKFIGNSTDSVDLRESDVRKWERVLRDNPNSPEAITELRAARGAARIAQIQKQKSLQTANSDLTKVLARIADAATKSGNTVATGAMSKFKNDTNVYNKKLERNEKVSSLINKLLATKTTKGAISYSPEVQEKVRNYVEKLKAQGYSPNVIAGYVQSGLRKGKHSYVGPNDANYFNDKQKLDVRDASITQYLKNTDTIPQLPAAVSGVISNADSVDLSTAQANIARLQRDNTQVNEDRTTDFSKKLQEKLNGYTPVSSPTSGNGEAIVVNGSTDAKVPPKDGVVTSVTPQTVTYPTIAPTVANLQDQLKFYQDNLSDQTGKFSNDDKKGFGQEILKIRKAIYTKNKKAEQGKSKAEKIAFLNSNSVRPIETRDGIVVDAVNPSILTEADKLLYSKQKKFPATATKGYTASHNLTFKQLEKEYNAAKKSNFGGFTGNVLDAALGTNDGAHRQDLDQTHLVKVENLITKIGKKLGTANRTDTLNVLYRTAKYDERAMIGELIYQSKYNKDSKFRDSEQNSNFHHALATTVVSAAPVGKVVQGVAKTIGYGLEKVGAKNLGDKLLATNVTPRFTSTGQSINTTAKNIGGRVRTVGSRSVEEVGVMSRSQNKIINGLNTEIATIDERIAAGVGQDLKVSLEEQKAQISRRISNIKDNPASTKTVYTNINVTDKFRVDEATLNQLENGTQKEVKAIVKTLGATDKEEAISAVKNRLGKIANQNKIATANQIKKNIYVTGINSAIDVHNHSAGDAPDSNNRSGSTAADKLRVLRDNNLKNPRNGLSKPVISNTATGVTFTHASLLHIAASQAPASVLRMLMNDSSTTKDQKDELTKVLQFNGSKEAKKLAINRYIALLDTKPILPKSKIKSIQSNNAGNIKTVVGTVWNGQINKNSNKFVEFSSPELGILALNKVLEANLTKVSTPKELILRYAAESKERTEYKRTGKLPANLLNYAKSVAKSQGIANIDGKLPKNVDMVKLIKVMIRHEGGKEASTYYTDKIIKDGMRLK